MARRLGKKDSRISASLVTENRAPCAFCHREVDDEATYGKLYAIGGLQCHYLCALLSCCLVQGGPEDEGLLGFLYKDIRAELERCRKHKCSYCGRAGANLGCSVSSCRKQFHLPCGREKNAVSLFYGTYKTFCQSHAPKQKIPEHIMCKAKMRMRNDKKKYAPSENADAEDNVCVICYESVDAFPTLNTFWPPCCARDAWFHRSCLQRMALSAGMHYLKCPLCNDKQNFYDAVINQGYYVPDRDAAWELEQNAFAEIYERPLTCTADNCLCPLGRSHDADQGLWDIKLCLLCGSVGAHAHCAGASETTFVCLTCTPAKPADMQALADTIDQMILQEQANSSSSVRHGPVMPSRMSLRRTKGRIPNLNRPSSSGTHNVKTESASPASPNIQASRRELNLKSPRKPMQNDFSPPKRSIHNSYKSPEKRTPMTHDYSSTDSYKMDVKLHSPLKLIQNCESYKSKSYNRDESYKNKESYGNTAGLLSPMKLLERSFKEKVVCMGGDAILNDKVVELFRCKSKKPGPLSEKKKIVDDILNSLFNSNALKQKEQMKPWFSPRKCDAQHKENCVSASYNVTKTDENTVETCTLGTPKKRKRTCQNSTRGNNNESKLKKTVDIKKDGDAVNVISDEKHRANVTDKVMDEKHHNNEAVEELVSEINSINTAIKNDDDKWHTNDKINENNDSPNSTFRPPSQSTAGDLSNDSIYPKGKTIEMKDSSLEISEQDHSVNISVLKIPDSPNLCQDVKKCSFKYSGLDKEQLDDSNVGIDLESFKKSYLNEVDRDYKFKNKHDDNQSARKVKCRTVIDCAVDHMHSNKNEVKSKKRKLSEGSVVLCYDKNEAKRRKMSENDLDHFSSDNFEIKREFKSKVEKVKRIQDKHNDGSRIKRNKKGSKQRRKERENRERRFSDLDRDCIKNNTNNDKKPIKDKLLKEQDKEKQIKIIKNEDIINAILDRKLDNKRIRKEIEEKRNKKNRCNEEREKRKPKDKRKDDKVEDRHVNTEYKETTKHMKLSKETLKTKESGKHIKISNNDKIKTDEKRKEKRNKNSEKHKDKHTDKRAKHRTTDKHDQNIKVTIGSKSKLNQETKLSINNNEKDISVKIKWKKKHFRLKIESKESKDKKEKIEKDNSKFQQYVLQYFSEVRPKEVLVKPAKQVSPLKRKYVKQDKTPDKLKQMCISNFFKVKSPTE